MGGLLDTSPIVSYSSSISKLDALEAHLSGGSLESWWEMWGSSPLLLREKLGIRNSLQYVTALSRRLVASLFPIHFKVGLFSFSWCVGISVFLDFFQSELFSCSCRLGVFLRGEFRNLLLCHRQNLEITTRHSGMGGNGWWGSENAIRTEKERDSHISGGNHLEIWNKDFKCTHAHTHTHSPVASTKLPQDFSLAFSFPTALRLGHTYINWLISHFSSSESDLQFTKILPVFPWESWVSYPRVPGPSGLCAEEHWETLSSNHSTGPCHQ